MIIQYADIRAALEEEPTPGPWKANTSNEIGPISQEDDQSFGMILPVAFAEFENSEANRRYIAACHPTAIRALLSDYDRMRVALMTIKEWPITSPLNMDSHNIQAVAHAVLSGDEDGR